ncbi:hypothetical protein QT979_17465 [Microcoleus sp. w2-18bC1]|uniref:hypothetical protein n=1 Tax=unclassified Microcoleus TaxID=2642155 RepID=UPI002FD315A3
MSGKVRQSDILTALNDRVLGFLAFRREVDMLRLSRVVGDRKYYHGCTHDDPSQYPFSKRFE